MPWYAWLLIGLFAGAVASFILIMIYFARGFRW